MKYLFLCPICLILSVCMVVIQEKKPKNHKVTATVIKGIASAVFVTFGILSSLTCQDLGFARLILAGQILGAVGDIVLELQRFNHKNQLTFYTGGISFFAGHVMYIIALIPKTGSWLLMSAISTVVIAGLICLVMYSVYHKSDLFFKVLSCVYVVGVTSLAMFGLGTFLESQSARTAMLMVGGIFFLISDVILIARMNADKTGWKGGLTLILFYYAAQLLIGGCLQLW